MSIQSVLIVEPDQVVRNELIRQLTDLPHVVATGTLAEARQRMEQDPPDLILTALHLADGSAADLLHSPMPTPVRPPALIVLTGLNELESAAECLREGALACLPKPFSRAHLQALLRRAAEHQRLVGWRRLATLRSEGTVELLGQSPAMEKLRGLVRQLAQSTAPVLIQGEPGTGKTTVARAIHQLGPRAHEAMIELDCAALPEAQLIDEWLADGPASKLDLARGGTVLLEEVGALGLTAQARLLERLREVEENADSGPGIRWIATSSRDLEAMQSRGQFHEELFYALNIMPVRLAPLRERVEDIPVLAEHFRARLARKLGVHATSMAARCLTALQGLRWPGNLTELAQVIEGALLRAGDATTLDLKHLPVLDADPKAVEAASADEADTLDYVERVHILKMLARCGGNRTRAAERLGISVRTLRNKLREYREAGLLNESSAGQ